MVVDFVMVLVIFFGGLFPPVFLGRLLWAKEISDGWFCLILPWIAAIISAACVLYRKQ